MDECETEMDRGKNSERERMRGVRYTHRKTQGKTKM